MSNDNIDINFVKNRILELRNTTSLSDRKLSAELGYNPSFIKEILSGKNKPSLDALINICDYFHISLSDFFDTEINNPILYKEIYRELERLCGNDLSKIIPFLKTLQPQDYQALRSIINRLINSENNKWLL